MFRTVDECPYRCDVEKKGTSTFVKCGLIQEISGVAEDSLCRVARDACEFCCHSPLPSSQEINPVLASLLYGLTEQILAREGVPGCEPSKAVAVQQWAEGQLDDEPAEVEQVLIPPRAVERCLYLGEPSGVRIHRAGGMLDRLPVFRCHHPNHRETTIAECDHCRDWSNHSGAVHVPVAQVLPVTWRRQAPTVRVWSVGVTTAPRRRPTLDWTLDSLARAGWKQARLFVDSAVTIPGRYADYPVTYREPKLGAWPNFYLGLTELLMRDPHADAYLMIQDDVIFHDREDLRAYLETILWPSERSGPISLYCSGVLARPERGWFQHTEPWFLGAHALIFSARAAHEFLTDPQVLAHRSSGSNDGLANIDTIVGQWAARQGTPMIVPSPSLCRHTGQTSSIWPAASMEGARKSGPFSGDLHIPDRLLDLERAAFPEGAFPCAAEFRQEYARRVERGRDRMRGASVVIGGLCRDVRAWLPHTAARVERLGQMFRRYQVVCLEADSADATLGFLETWADQNPAVHVLRGNPGLALTTGLGRPRSGGSSSHHREMLRRYVIENLPEYDHVLVIDMDLAGGWSYDGVADTFGREGWDFVGSNGLMLNPTVRSDAEGGPIFFDTWAFRDVGHDDPHPEAEVHGRSHRRGEPLRPVWSCFGGLGVYRRECWEAAVYSGRSPEHVGFHQHMRALGFHRLFLNPSQIVLYDEPEAADRRLGTTPPARRGPSVPM
jgi:hypothetical protein